MYSCPEHTWRPHDLNGLTVDRYRTISIKVNDRFLGSSLSALAFKATARETF